jgi:hypothetical protein
VRGIFSLSFVFAWGLGMLWSMEFVSSSSSGMMRGAAFGPWEAWVAYWSLSR